MELMFSIQVSKGIIPGTEQRILHFVILSMLQRSQKNRSWKLSKNLLSTKLKSPVIVLLRLAQHRDDEDVEKSTARTDRAFYKSINTGKDKIALDDKDEVL